MTRAICFLIAGAALTACSDKPSKSDAGGSDMGPDAATVDVPQYRVGGTFELGLEALRPAVFDVDGDGALDIVVGHQFSEEIRVFLGDGNGSFSVEADVEVGRSAGFGVADFDGDGATDLVLAVDAEMDLLLVKDLLGAAEVATYTLPGSASGLVAEDVDGDGDADVAVSIVGLGEAPLSEVVVFINDDGALDGPTRLTMPFPPYNVRGVDIGGDDILDLFVLLNTSAGVVLTGDGAGNFAVGAPFEVGEGVLNATILDADGLGELDLVAADLTADALTLAADIPRGTGVKLAEIAAPFDVLAVRANNDDKVDIVATSVDDEAIIGLVSDADGKWARGKLFALEGATRLGAMAAGDFDGDGLDDLAVIERGRDEPGTLHIVLTSALPER